MNIYAVWIGGAIGAGLRYSVGLLLPYQSGFPFAIWCVNSIGAFLLSWLLSEGLLATKPHLKLALTTGVLGAFTTFSTFSAETVQLIEESLLLALLYVGSSIGGGLLCSYAGYVVATRRNAGC